VKAWLLTLVCPGLGQMGLGAKGRGLATLIVVTGSLLWLGWVDYVVIQGFLGERITTLAQPGDLSTVLGLVSDPELWDRLESVSSLPGSIFLVSFLYSFVDSAMLAYQSNG
jgi:TM2 domain-containing membrane protein YozV